jgi:hypothetical protein
LRVREKFVDLSGPISNERFNVSRRTIAKPNPEDFRWMPFQETPLTKISVFGDDRPAVFGRVCPDRRVRRFAQSDIPDMNAVGKQSANPLHNLGDRFWSSSSLTPEGSPADVRGPQQKPGRLECPHG